jgi:lipopolysaccharide export system protein LptA
METSSGSVSATGLDVYLKEQPGSQATATLSLDADQIERAIARDRVRIAEGNREGTGDIVEYLPANGEVHLSGQLAKVTDPQKGTVQAPELTYFLGDDTIQVQGSPGSPTETRWQVHP